MAGNRISKGFQRIPDPASRFLKVYEEYKDNILIDFPELEGNGTQLRQNNAMLDLRVNLTTICIDDIHYSLAKEGDKLINTTKTNTEPRLPLHLQSEDPGNIHTNFIKRRIDQVKNRICIVKFNKNVDTMIEKSKRL
ncbi:MAG: hypothetical protein RL662_2034 [Bacteroidota bacterium]|jgi:hypothetical protein